tara:strand:- start:1280 stop:2500 length:1221 start_codon:yes stop_codon:yes gene_type:complete
MPRFRYQALTNTGSTVSNVEDANSKAELVSSLKIRGYWPTDIVEDIEGNDDEESKFRFSIRRRVKPKDVEFFTYQIGTLINSHIPLARALDITLEQIASITLRQVIHQVKYDVEHGSTFANALAEHPKVFSDLYINMVKAGEAGGVLGVVLARLAEFAEGQRHLKNEVVSALFYPAVLFVLSGLAIAVLMVAVVPKFTVMFEDMGTQLPPLTRGLIGFANFVSGFWWIILIMIIVLSIAFSRFIQLENGRLIFDRIKIRLPLIGQVFNSFAIIRFTQTMATLMENGVTLLPALRVVKDTIGNKVYSNAVLSAEQEIERGSTLARELERTKVFPPVVMHMISVGEESGSPQQMMSKLSEYYDLETKKNLERLTSLVGPLVILFMGVIIGLIAFAIIDPILKMSASIG